MIRKAGSYLPRNPFKPSLRLRAQATHDLESRFPRSVIVGDNPRGVEAARAGA